jgi:potassium efflux system protein
MKLISYKNRAFAVGTLLVLTSLAFGQAADELAAAEISSATIENRIAQVEGSSTYDEQSRSSALDYYRRALASLELAKGYREAAARFEQALTEAPAEAKRLEAALANDFETDPLASLKGAGELPAREIEQLLQQERANEAAANAVLSELEQKLASETSRPQAARLRLSAASQEVRAAIDRLSSPVVESESEIVLEAHRWAQQSAAAALSAEMVALDKEMLSQPVRLALLQLQRDEAAANTDRNQERVRALQTLLSERRRDETEQVIGEMDLESLGTAATHPLVKQGVLENQALADELDSLSDALEQITAANDIAVEQLAELRQRFQSTRQRLEVAGVGQAMGRFLGEESRKLPALNHYRHETRLREDQIAVASLRAIHLREQRRDVRDADRFVGDLLVPLPEDQAQDIRPALLQLAHARGSLLQQAITLNDNYLRRLADDEYTQKELAATVSDYRDFVAERLLWVRSRDAIGLSDVLALPGEILDVASPGRWIDVTTVFFHNALHSPLQIAAILILLLFFWKRDDLRKRLKLTAAKVGKPSEDSFALTAKAVVITLIMSLPWPLFTAVTGFELINSLQASAASRAVGEPLLRLSPLLFFLRAFRLLCTPGGVAEAHFRWSGVGLKRLRKQMDELLLTLLLPGFAMLVNRGFQDIALGGALSQVMFLIIAGGLMTFLHRLLRPHTGIAQSLRRRVREDPVLRWPWLWITAATVIPLGVAVMASAGFMYSAGTLLSRLIYTMWLMFGLAVMRELIVRWLLVIKRRLLLRQALQRREAARVARETGDGDTVATDEHGLIAEDDAMDIASLDSDTRKLVNVSLIIAAILGIAGIWSSVLPALGIFADITLWHYVSTIGGQDVLQAVTLIDLLVAVMAVIVTIVAAGNVPSLIEIILRQRPSITAGSRLASATLARYTIAVIGIGFTLSTIGINWGKLQWLVAALGVGIGFGLQEIVANFISGLIILMERPIRVGDMVTVGEISGTVSRVQIRATTIRTRDRQELLVPNKEFITGRVLNWSLSDEIVRIRANVGIAYGSDVENALRLIGEAANEHPDVLADPAPLVTFEEFGDNALILGLRCFVESLDVRLETGTSLHRAINQKFNDAGISIAFPQRDIHLDTTNPLDVRILQGATLEPTTPS